MPSQYDYFEDFGGHTLNDEEIMKLHQKDNISAITFIPHYDIILLGTKNGTILALSAIDFKVLFTYLTQKGEVIDFAVTKKCFVCLHSQG